MTADRPQQWFHKICVQSLARNTRTLAKDLNQLVRFAQSCEIFERIVLSGFCDLNHDSILASTSQSVGYRAFRHGQKEVLIEALRVCQPLSRP